MTSGRRLLPAALAALALAACSSGSGGGDATSPASPAAPASASPGTSPASPSASPSPSAVAGLEAASADEILAQARAALLAAPTVRARGAVVSDRTSYAIDLHLVRRKGATGTMSTGGKKLRLLRIGEVAYVKLDAAFLRAATGSDQAARTLAGTYLKLTSASSSTFAPIVALTDVEQAFGSALAPAGSVSKGAVTRMGGRRVVDVKVAGAGGGHVYVALDGTPYPVRIAYGSSATQHVDFDSFGAKVALAAPPAGQVRTVPGF